jgi:hypothetical protein
MNEPAQFAYTRQAATLTAFADSGDAHVSPSQHIACNHTRSGWRVPIVAPVSAGACSYCGTHVPPVVMNAIKNDQLIGCRTCERLLVA